MFLEEIKPYIKDLEVYQVQQSLPNEVKRKAIFAIFDKYIKFKEYPSSAKTSIGCGACVKNVMNRLFGLLQREQAINANPPKLSKSEQEEFKKEWTKYSKDVIISFKEEKIDSDDELIESLKAAVTPIEVLDIKSMRWGELKKYATSQGIKVAGKKKVEILKELGV